MTSPWEHLSVLMLDRFSTRTWLTRFDSVIVTMIMVAICLKEKGRLHKNMKHLLDQCFKTARIWRIYWKVIPVRSN